MRYRVAFAKRFQSDGNESAINPAADLDVEIPDGVVADKTFVGRFDPESKHSQEVLDEDDAFLGLAAAELWDYDVVDGREDDFTEAMRNSEMVMEFTVVDETSVDPDDAIGTNLDDSDTKTVESIDSEDEITGGGSGRRGGDDGPGGPVTGDPSAGEMAPSRSFLANDEVDDLGGEDSGGIDSLTVMSANDPTLGLTDLDGKSPDDWAADTGPTVTAESGTRARRRVKGANG